MGTWKDKYLAWPRRPRDKARAVRERLALQAVRVGEDLAALRRRAGHQDPAAAAAAAKAAVRAAEELAGVEAGADLEAAEVEAATCHVLFLAWRRYEYAARTLAAFAQWNELAFGLWYGLDGGYDERLPALAESYGYKRLVVNTEHRGIARTVDALVGALAAQVEPNALVLLLEEDWEACRPLPMDTVCQLLSRPGLAWVRCVGRARQRPEDGFDDPYRIGPWPNERWRRETLDGEQFLTGPSRWAHLPHVVKLRALRRFVKGSRNERDSIVKSAASGLHCVWLLEPCFWHIGAVRSVRSLGGRE